MCLQKIYRLKKVTAILSKYFTQKGILTILMEDTLSSYNMFKSINNYFLFKDLSY